MRATNLAASPADRSVRPLCSCPSSIHTITCPRQANPSQSYFFTHTLSLRNRQTRAHTKGGPGHAKTGAGDRALDDARDDWADTNRQKHTQTNTDRHRQTTWVTDFEWRDKGTDGHVDVALSSRK
jgi:hypothetical protein